MKQFSRGLFLVFHNFSSPLNSDIFLKVSYMQHLFWQIFSHNGVFMFCIKSGLPRGCEWNISIFNCIFRAFKRILCCQSRLNRNNYAMRTGVFCRENSSRKSERSSNTDFSMGNGNGCLARSSFSRGRKKRTLVTKCFDNNKVSFLIFLWRFP